MVEVSKIRSKPLQLATTELLEDLGTFPVSGRADSPNMRLSAQVVGAGAPSDIAYPEMAPSSAASGRAPRSQTRALDALCNGGLVQGFLGSRRSPLGSSFCARKVLGAPR